MARPPVADRQKLAQVTALGEGVCWPWPGRRDKDGYGKLANERTAHRWVYKELVGPIPDGLVIDHICHDPTACAGGKSCPHRACVNPAHMRVITAAENNAVGRVRCLGNRSSATCRKGHPYPDPTPLRNGRWKVCPVCARARTARSAARKVLDAQ